MSAQVERLDHNMAKLTIEVSAADFKEAVHKVYLRQRGKIQIPGFRKGKAPQMMIEKMYGKGVFYEDAANDMINATYPAEASACGLEIVSSPEIDVTDIGEDGMTYTATFAVKPEVTLGAYKGIEVPKANIMVTDEDIENEIKSELEKNSRIVDVTDRPVQNGDTVNLDYAGTVDGEAFDGGTAQGQPLVIGSGSFIPGFEEQLIGLNAGDEKDVEVTFPEDYHAPELAGQDAVFHCVINKIQTREMPVLDDEYVQDTSEFDTVDEYKENIHKTLIERKEKAAQTDKENAVVDKLIETSEMDIPGAMIDSQVSDMYNEYAQQLQSQGIGIDMYLKYMGQTESALKEQMRPQAEKRIKTRLVLEEVAKVENIEVGDEKVEAELEKMAEQYKMPLEDIKKYFGDYQKDEMKKDLAVQEAITLLCDNAVEV